MDLIDRFLRVAARLAVLSRDRKGAVAIVCAALCCCAPLAGRVITTGDIVERDGLARSKSLLEQGVPVVPMTEAEAATLVLRRTDGKPLQATVEPEAKDQDGKVAWVRISALVSIPAHGRIPVRIETGAPAAPRLNLQQTPAGITVRTDAYTLNLRNPGNLELTAAGQTLLSGNWGVDLIADARGILWGTYLREFTLDRVLVEDQSPSRATLLLHGFLGKNYRKNNKVSEPGRRFDCELRLFVSALSPDLRYAWRITNLTGTKTWLQRYSLLLPLAGPGKAVERSSPDRLLVSTQAGGRLAVTADFIDDLGKGAGLRVPNDRPAIMIGGLDMPPDGGFYSGRVPDIHRLFYNGMSRTFGGALVTNSVTSGSLSDAAAARALLDIVLPPQYYSDTKALPNLRCRRALVRV